MRVELTIPGRFPGMNDYVRACKQPQARARMKRECDEMVTWACVRAACPSFRPPVAVTVDCYERDGRRDPDNVQGMARKFVLDGLQKAGVLENDSRRWVPVPPPGRVEVDRDDPRVVVTIEGECA